jgi:hypothetical protein
MGVVLTLVDQRTAHSREVVRVVRSSLSGQVNVFDTEVRLHVALKEAARAGRTILDYDTRAERRRLSATGVRCCRCGDGPPVVRPSKARSPPPSSCSSYPFWSCAACRTASRAAQSSGRVSRRAGHPG